MKKRVLDMSRTAEFEVTQLRLGRLYAEEQKGRLEGFTDEEILWLLDPANPEQKPLDDFEMGQIRANQEKPNAETILRDSVPVEERKSD